METITEMRVTKRDGELQEVAFDKILERVKKLGQEAGIHINYSSLVMKVIDQLYDKIPTAKIDELAAEQCASLSTNHPDYATLAARIIISNHQKNTHSHFSNIVMLSVPSHPPRGSNFMVFCSTTFIPCFSTSEENTSGVILALPAQFRNERSSPP